LPQTETALSRSPMRIVEFALEPVGGGLLECVTPRTGFLFGVRQEDFDGCWGGVCWIGVEKTAQLGLGDRKHAAVLGSGNSLNRDLLEFDKIGCLPRFHRASEGVAINIPGVLAD